MITVCTLASGSKGNAVLLSDGTTHILADAGISARRIDRSLQDWGLCAADLSAVLVTHEHGDHISGLARLKRPVYASSGTCAALEKLGLPMTVLKPGRSYELGTLGITPFRTPHDTPESFGFLVHMKGFRVCVCTDLGYMPSEVLDILRTAHYLLLEANHDTELVRSGPYPAFLKDRVLGRRGHLSNDCCAEAVTEAVKAGTRRVTLCHLSEENNSPDLALAAVAEALYKENILPGRDVHLDTAPQHACGMAYLGTPVPGVC